MAPFMVLGTKVRKPLHLPGLHIKAEKEQCISCKACNKKCPMSLDVCAMVKDGQEFGSECIQCGECVDACPKKVLKYSMNKEK
ncbi:MAG: 4Fe-4S dicluster domain-containing protein [Clostridiales bacterium]|nr:4Fe-4S dicluster domain-containing protein [Clostridiales bacterium]